MLNTVIISGNLVNTPEIRETQSGLKVANFRIANNVDGDDENTNFISLVAWRKTAEIAASYNKGDFLTVTGFLRVSSYKDKNGNNRTATEVVANRVYGQRRQPQQGNANNFATTVNQPAEPEQTPTTQSGNEPTQQSLNEQGFQELEKDDDLPF